MIIGIQDELLRINSLGLLDGLLADRTTRAHILWATDAYTDLGPGYQRDKEIKAELITGERSGVIKNSKLGFPYKLLQCTFGFSKCHAFSCHQLLTQRYSHQVGKMSHRG